MTAVIEESHRALAGGPGRAWDRSVLPAGRV